MGCRSQVAGRRSQVASHRLQVTVLKSRQLMKIENLDPILNRICIQNDTSFYKFSVIERVISHSNSTIATLQKRTSRNTGSNGLIGLLRYFFVQILC